MKTSTVHSPEATASLSFSSTTTIVVAVLCCVALWFCVKHKWSGTQVEGPERAPRALVFLTWVGEQEIFTALLSWWPGAFSWATLRKTPHPNRLAGESIWAIQRHSTPRVIKPEEVRMCMCVSECANAYVCNEHALVLKEPCISDGLLPSSSGTEWCWNVLGILCVLCHKWCSECCPKREGVDQDLRPE